MFLFCSVVKMKIQRLLLSTFLIVVLQCGCKSVSFSDVDRIQRDLSRHKGSYALNAEKANGNRLMMSHGTDPRLIKYVTFSKTKEADKGKNNFVHAWQWIRATTSDLMKSVKDAFRKCFGI